MAPRILGLKEAFRSKVYLSVSDQFVYAAITLVKTVEIDSFTYLDLKLAKEAHAYFEKAILMIKAMDLD